jgi:hypothetical protein
MAKYKIKILYNIKNLFEGYMMFNEDIRSKQSLFVFLYYFIVIIFDWHTHYMGTMIDLNKVVLSSHNNKIKLLSHLSYKTAPI